MSARLNTLCNVIKSRVPVMSLQCRRLLDSSILPSIPDFEGAMDCSLREEKDVLDLCPRYFDEILQVL